MNYHLTRIRLVSVGPEPARFDPLDLTLMNPEGTGPADSVLYLPNTGGKTVLLRLLFSVLHPPIVERIGTEEAGGSRRSKNLVGYVLERDTAHIVLEWRRADQGKFTDGERLLTGLVAEWRGGQPTGNPGDLVRVWYTVKGPVDDAGIDQLVFDVPSKDDGPRRRLPLRAFKERLDEWGRGRGAPAVTTTDTQRVWVDHLDKLGLDPALFRYQGQMNHNEAGASAIAKFTSDLAFISFFVQAVMDPSELDLLDRQFEEVADKVRRYPEYELWLRFQRTCLAEMEVLALAVREEAEARAVAENARLEGLGLLASFAAGEAVARERAREEDRRMTDRAAEARRQDNLADRTRDDWRAYRQVEARMKLDEAKVRADEAVRAYEEAVRTVRGWEVGEWLVLFQQAKARVASLQVQYSAEQQRLRPKQQRRDDAGSALRARYLAIAVVAEADAAEEKGRAEALLADAKAVRKEQQDAHDESVAAAHHAKSLLEQVAAVRGVRDRLMTRGVIQAGESTTGARDRIVAEGAAANAGITRLDEELETLDAETDRLDEEDRIGTARQLEVRGQHVAVSREVADAEKERTGLATDPLVLEVAETTPVDLEVLGAAIAARLLHQEAQAQSERIALELHAADDCRAVASLRDTRLLPPAPDLEAALACLRAAGITSAMAGTAYLAEAEAVEARYATASRCPEIVGGIVLTDPEEVARAEAALAAWPTRPALLITVSDAAQVFKASSAPRQGSAFLVAPAEAVWNPDAGDAERKTRETRLGTYEARRARLTERGRRARELAENLGRHLAAYPKGRLAAQRVLRDALATELAELAEAAETRAARRHEIGQGRRSRREERLRLEQVGRTSAEHQHLVSDLLTREENVAGFEAKAEREQVEAMEWQRQSDELEQEDGRLQAERDLATQRAVSKQAAAAHNREEAKVIRLAKVVAEPALPHAQNELATGKPLAELQTWFTRLDKELSMEMSASVVAADLQNAIDDRDQKQAQIQRNTQDIQERAALLLTLPEASSEAGRHRATEEARGTQQQADGVRQRTHTALEQARQGLEDVEEEIRRSDHPVRLTPERMPRDRHHVALLIAETRQAADAASVAASTARQESEAAGLAKREADDLAKILRSYGVSLKMGLGLEEEASVPQVAPFTGSMQAAQSQGMAISKRLQETRSALAAAREASLDCDKKVRAVLTQFAELAGKYPLHVRLTTSSLDLLARDAEPLIQEMQTSIGVLGNEIATRTEDMKLAASSLARTVNKTITLLRSAERRSRMPASLRGWGHEEFLAIRFEKPQVNEVETRLLPFVTEVLSRPANRPAGSDLLLQALERAIGKFQVTILKPNEAFDPIRVPIAEMSSNTFSNGQRSTVATALMLMLSELRHQSRSANRGASVGSLLLDNPFGNANAGFLIEVQRAIAAAAGIQLVYLTGIKDYNALRHFPNVVALSNNAARRSMRRYVVANPDLLKTVVPAEDKPGGRVTAARVVDRTTGNGRQ